MARRGARRSTGRRQGAFVFSLALLFLFITGSIGYLCYRQVRGLVIGSDFLPDLTSRNPGEIEWRPGDPLPTWEGNERVNILVMGIDERADEEGPWRTDTMLVLTVDPLTKSGGMLSIPRDLWVPIPGYDEGRINTANYLGDAYNYPGGGPALAMRTVQWNLGVPIHHYARINFRTFVEMVNLIGGIDVYVEQEINDQYYPGEHYDYDPLYIPAGWVHMDGELALKYARTRHSAGGDFDRAQRQQQVLMAILDKVTRLDLLPQLVPQAPQLWQTLSESIQTDLALDQIIALANLATQAEREDIRTAVIDEHYTQFWQTPDGQQVLVPVREQMRELRDYIFTTEPEIAAEDDQAARLAAEGATVEVQNGTAVAGLASRTAEYLEGQGIQVADLGNADRSDYAESLIYVYTGKSFTAEAIGRLLSLPPTAIVPVENPQMGADIVVILGADLQLPMP
jgi:LCP family protein required for cell wall assembly